MELKRFKVTFLGKYGAAGRRRGSRLALTTMYITGVSWKGVGGYEADKINFSNEPTKATEFSRAAADGLATYLTRCRYQEVKVV
jgi:hypothetical protein